MNHVPLSLCITIAMCAAVPANAQNPSAVERRIVSRDTVELEVLSQGSGPVIVMLPSLVLLVVIGSYLNSRSVLFEGVFIGLTTWPWVARAVRAQTFSLRSREFVEMAKLSGRRPVEIIVKDIAPNMASYLFLVVILLFGSSMLLAASYDFLGLGPSNTVSLGWMMNQATQNAALLYREWWWFIPPGAVLTAMVAALLVANVGLDEVFNPKLRQQ